MKVRGGEFSTGTMGNFQPELTDWCLRPLARRLVLCTRCRGRVRAGRKIVY
jgi:hypothetical protein